MDKPNVQLNINKDDAISIVVCTHTRVGMGKKSCGGSHSQLLIEELRRLLAEQSLDIQVREQVCFGRCDEGIVMRIAPGKEFYTQVTAASLADIVDRAKSYLS